ncbi:mlkA [Symbiodinium natans]|uniref:MlkA protein n=1 Tax=Symbiodinium natans TaxID=878477 RepID=A0A812UGX1_9DINO|nr:mlkA [Symbiodinium natans]
MPVSGAGVLVVSLVQLAWAQYEIPQAAMVPKGYVTPGCFQDNLEDNQVYYQRVKDMFNPHQTNTYCGGNLSLNVNHPCTWCGGQAQMTVGPVINQCQWSMRAFHWHDSSNEWGSLTQGVMQVYLASPNSLPWKVSVNTIGAGGVWFFPMGWPHAFLCVSEEGCNYVLTFDGPQAVAVNDHMLAQSYSSLPSKIASFVQGMTEEEWATAKPKVDSVVPDFYVNVNPEEFKWLEEELALPAAVNGSDVEVKDNRPNLGVNVEVWNIRTAQFPFATQMSQQRIKLGSCGFRSPVWITNANALMTVVSGKVNAFVQGGISGGFDIAISGTTYNGTNLEANDAFYFPIRRNYWIEEATCEEGAEAEVIVIFDVGDWVGFEMADGFGCRNTNGGIAEGARGVHQALGGIHCPETVPNEPQLRQKEQKGQLRRHRQDDAMSFLQQPGSGDTEEKVEL